MKTFKKKLAIIYNILEFEFFQNWNNFFERVVQMNITHENYFSFIDFPVDIHLFNKRRHWRRSGVFIVSSKHISHLVLVFLFLTLSR